MPKGMVGSMSTMGFISEPQIKAAKKIDYWFAARKNQSIIIAEVESYQYIKESAQGTLITIDEFCEKIKNSLYKVLIEAFDKVEIDVRHESDNNSTSTFHCIFSGTVTEDGVGYDIAKAVIFNNKSYERIDEGRNG